MFRMLDRSLRASAAALRKVCVHHITDIEGHYPTFHNSIVRSQIVEFDRQNRLNFQPNVENPYFVYGGDLTDRGLGDIALIEKLLDFKLRHPERVFLLAGNREAAKTRIHTELNPKHIRARLLHGDAPHWLKSRPHVVPVDYLKKYMQQPSSNPAEIEAYVEALPIETCQLVYLKWMLEQNLGCPHTFVYTKKQLADRSGRHEEDVSDYEVLRSFINQNSPSGLMGQYLRQTQAAVIIPETGILVVHGGLTPENTGRTPTMRLSDAPIDDAVSWINQFNAWYQQELQRWTQTGLEELPLQLQPARNPLDCFSVQVPQEYRPIVTASMLDEQRQFIPVPDAVSRYLNRNKIHLVLTGHQPSGDHPAILRSHDDSVVFINGDTGYANEPEKNTHDTRGLAGHTLQIIADRESAKVKIDARLTTEGRVSTKIKIEQGRVTSDHYVGRILPDNALVQCQLNDGNYRIIQQKGFAVDYTTRTPVEVAALLGISSPQQSASLIC